MTKIKLITDSTSDLRKSEIEKYDIEVLPVKVTIDGQEFDSIDNEEYIYKMRDAKQFFTSQPSVGLFLEAYKKWTDLGYSVISIHISSAVSGTYSTAASVAKEFNNVFVIDSMTASRGMHYYIEDAYKYIKEGKGAEEIYKLLIEKQNKIITYVTIDRLDNLVKGGRLKKSAGLIGGLLNLKILTKLYPEELAPVDKVRGKKRLIQSLIENLKNDVAGKEIKKVSLVNVLAYEYIDSIKEEIAKEFNYKISDEDIFITTPAISTHTGEGAVGIIVEIK
ncbi:DegV family protein [Gemella sp. zg-1178]|uniref:DegV family protein n=1 Tax=Gemella sp. zg-1178 TaxID=2840372 RepID=UPI001C04D550|nr:DegV family protein [Gemella sp. zg-1178]MBU0279320.1 DegV family protein [Gemella sp. zg-1178]